ncbi:MAG: hypothetical protein QM485_05425 [Flavobacteriaceae bacterium]
MRSYLFLVPALFLLIIWSSCRKDLEYAQSSGNLAFSKDTVFLDTIFSNIGSSTYMVKVYNKTRDDVEIPFIRLEQGQSSYYRLNVDGVAGKEFNNVLILAQDSMFIFIETTYDASANNSNSFLYTDAIHFDAGINLQKIQLVTLVKDAIFLFPSTLSDGTKETLVLGLDENGKEIRVNGFHLSDDELEFTNEKPYVIYGYAAVTKGKELRMNAGTRVNFHKDSGILITKGASLKINGELSSDQELLENEVIFEGDRLESGFENLSGQWGTIWLSKGSVDNVINHLTLKNATVGLLVEGDKTVLSPTLIIKNTQIYNSASVNLWAKTATIIGENCVFGGAGNSSLYCNLGGYYLFTHTTIANYWVHGFRTGTALEIDNFTNDKVSDLIKADFINCIIDGNMTRELYLGTNSNDQFNYSFSNCLIKFKDGKAGIEQNPLYDFENTSHYNSIYLNRDADFKEANRNDLRIGEMSFAGEKADLDISLLLPFDILGIDRTSSSDIGAYQINKDQD